MAVVFVSAAWDKVIITTEEAVLSTRIAVVFGYGCCSFVVVS